MRLALLADLHGNLPALEAVEADLKREGPVHQVIVLGDLVAFGAFPQETVEKVRRAGWVAVQGNCDRWFLRDPATDLTSGQAASPVWAAYRWARARMSEEEARWLAELPFRYELRAEEEQKGPAGQRGRGGGPVLATFVHASPRDIEEGILPGRPDEELRPLVAGVQGSLLGVGHTHLQFQRALDGLLLVNPGSVGRPADGDPRTAYALLSWEGGRWSVELRRLPYDVEAAARALVEREVPGGRRLAELLRAGRLG
ncbi:MAG: metallophosphoesterase family protein [Bacillota bacterium]|nr:metallophosphoesterase family protein [Bacillota bacterium]